MKAGERRTQVLARMRAARDARREAVTRARRDLPSYSDEDVEEITGRFAALSADAAAHAVADALGVKHNEKPEGGGGGWFQRNAKTFEYIGKIAAAVAAGCAGLATFAHWVLGLF
jgi:hypothetical protein